MCKLQFVKRNVAKYIIHKAGNVLVLLRFKTKPIQVFLNHQIM